MRPILRLLPLEYWRNLRLGSRSSRGDQLFQIGLIDAAAQMAEVFENLPAGQVGVERQLARQIADQPLDRNRLLPDIQPGDARRASVGA